MEKKHKIFSSIGISAIALFSLVIAERGIDGSFLSAKFRNVSQYGLSLNSSNSFAGGSGTKVVYTNGSNPVTFSYTSCSSLSGGHVKINENGTIANEDHIRSITGVTPVFTCSSEATSFEFRASYDKETWGQWGSLASGKTRQFESGPYYFEFKAINGAVNLTSLNFEYSCERNWTVEPEGEDSGTKEFVKVASALDDYAGTYLIVCESEGVAFDGSLTKSTSTAISASGNKFAVTITDGKIAYTDDIANKVFEITDDGEDSSGNMTYQITSHSGYKITNTADSNSMSVLDVDDDTDYYNWIGFCDNDGSDNDFYIKGSGGSYLRYNSSNTQFRYYKSSTYKGQAEVFLYKLSNGSVPIGIPEYEAKLQITDNNSDNYIYGHSLSESFGTEDFKASVLMSNGTETAIDPSQLTIDIEKGGAHYASNTALNSEGTYNVTISYGELAPVKYQITVSKIAVASVTFDKSSLRLKPSEDYTLTATVLPETAFDKSLTWTSTNNSVATVSTSGKVTAVADGTATIKATANNGIYASCEVTVASAGLVDPGMQAAYEAAIALSNSSESNSSYEFTGVVVGTRTSGSNKDVYVQSGDYALDVYNSGKTMAYKDEVTVKSTLTKYSGIPETKTIKSFTNNGQSVLPQANVINSASDLADAKINTLLNASGTIKTLSASGSSITGSNDVTITLTTSNGDIAVFAKKNSYSGIKTTLQGFKVGDIMNIENGIRGIYNTTDQVLLVSESVVTKGTPVHVDVTGITVSPTNVDVNVNSTTTLTATIAPANASNKGVVWSSSNSNVASVNQNGVVSGHIAGQSATIYAKSAENNSISASCTVNVKAISVQSVSLDQNTATIAIGEELTLTHTISPSTASNQNVTWSSNDQSVATVSNGVVSALAEGEATITVKTDDGNHTASCVVTVTEKSAVKEWVLVTTASQLIKDNLYVIACNSKGTTAGDISSSIMASLGSTFSNDKSKITTLNNDTVQLKLGGTTDKWTFANSDGDLLGATAVKKLAWGSGTTTWKITFSGNDCNLTNTSSSYGSMSYNSSSPRFTTYSATQTAIQLYTLTGGATPTPEPTLESIKVDSSSHRTFTVGDTFAKETIMAVYSDGNEVDVTSEAAFSGYNMNSAGTQTVSVSYGGKSTSYQITVNAKVVTLTSITVSENHRTFNVGDTFVGETVTAYYSDGSHKEVNATFSGYDMSTAGTYTVSVSYTEGGITKDTSYTITVKSSGSGGGGASGTHTILSSDVPTSYETDGEKTVDDITYVFNQVANSYTPGYMQCKKSVSYIYNKTAIAGLKSISINTSSKSWGGSVYYGTSEEPSANKATLSGGKYSIPSGNSYFNIVTNGSTGYIESIDIEYSTTPVNPTAISISGENELTPGSSTQLSLSFSPSNCNVKDVTWSSNNTSITVDQTGKVTVSSTAKVGATATITATSREVGTVKGTFTITVVDKPVVQKDAWTMLIYMCGADLESGYASNNDGCATDDLKEIYSLRNSLPDDVNIVVQAGGAKAWSSEYSSVISKDKRNRFHLTKSGYVKDSQDSRVNMGSESSLEDFVEWGLETYPAEKVGLVFWDHGSAMGGCCFDEQYSSDGLTPAEVASAVPTAISKSGYNQNLEFIGYDCCLMSIQDIAGLNAQYANYMIASQESEWGYGWSYDKFVDNLMSKKSTTTILKACVDGFSQDTTSSYNNWGDPNDQTLAYYNLQNWAAYENAWEDFADYLSTSVIKSSSNWTTFTKVVNQAQKYGYDSDSNYQKYNGGYCYDIFDVKDFLNKIKSSNDYKNNSSLMTKVSTIETAYTGLGIYSKCGSAAGNSNGLCFFCPLSGYNEIDGEYASANTRFKEWRSLCVEYGKWY